MLQRLKFAHLSSGFIAARVGDHVRACESGALASISISY